MRKWGNGEMGKCESAEVRKWENFHESRNKDLRVLHGLDKRADPYPQANEKRLHQNLRESLRQKDPNCFPPPLVGVVLLLRKSGGVVGHPKK